MISHLEMQIIYGLLEADATTGQPTAENITHCVASKPNTFAKSAPSKVVIYQYLNRMEKRGWLSKKGLTESTPFRGGRALKMWELTPKGKQIAYQFLVLASKVHQLLSSEEGLSR